MFLGIKNGLLIYGVLPAGKNGLVVSVKIYFGSSAGDSCFLRDVLVEGVYFY